MSDRHALTQLLLEQEAELGRYTTTYVGAESSIFEHTESSDYATLDATGKAAYTKKLTELTKEAGDDQNGKLILQNCAD